MSKQIYNIQTHSNLATLNSKWVKKTKVQTVDLNRWWLFESLRLFSGDLKLTMSTMTELNQTRASRLKHGNTFTNPGQLSDWFSKIHTFSALSDWREVVLHANSVLTWDQEWYSGVVFGIVTAFYLAVWYWDPTLVTFVAFSGLFLTLADYVGPKIINQVRCI